MTIRYACLQKCHSVLHVIHVHSMLQATYYELCVVFQCEIHITDNIRWLLYRICINVTLIRWYFFLSKMCTFPHFDTSACLPRILWNGKCCHPQSLHCIFTSGRTISQDRDILDGAENPILGELRRGRLGGGSMLEKKQKQEEIGRLRDKAVLIRKTR